MVPPISHLVKLARATRAMRRRAKASPVDYIAWLPYQKKWLSHTDPRPALLRLGNRMGKSTCGGAELIFRCRGVHPYKEVKQAPVRVALVTMSMVQSVEIQRVLWELLGGEDNTELAPGTEFSSRTGFRGHRPVIEFLNGSEIHVYSNAQGAGALAGAEYDYILLDEPPEQVVYDECRARVRNTGGGIGITLTPINGPPLPWLRALTEEDESGEPPRVVDYHQPLTAESQISPLTGLVRRTKNGRPWDEDFIRELRRLENPIDAPIRLDGEWESRTEGQFFTCFDPLQHVTPTLPAGKLKLALGMDYAAADRELGMCAVLTAIDMVEEEDGRSHPHLYVLAEVVVPGNTTMEMFARKILRMLQDLGIQWHELDYVFGDNPVRSRHVASSNLELSRWVARRLKVDRNHLRPRIMSAKEGAGKSGRTRRSKDIRCRWAYGAIAAGRVRVSPRCPTLIKAYAEWDYTDKHPYKDILDAWMYGLRDVWNEASRWGALPATVRVR